MFPDIGLKFKHCHSHFQREIVQKMQKQAISKENTFSHFDKEEGKCTTIIAAGQGFFYLFGKFLVPMKLGKNCVIWGKKNTQFWGK